MKNSNLAFVKNPSSPVNCPSPLIQASVFPGKGVEKHCPAVLRKTSDRAPWCPNLGEFKWQAWLSESWTLFYNRTAWLLPGRGAKAEESKFPSHPQWCHWPVRRLWPIPGNACKSDVSSLLSWLEYHTFTLWRHPVSEGPIADFNSPLLLFFFKKQDNWFPFHPALHQSGKTVWWLPD